MVINGLTQAEIDREVARLERILLEQEVRLTPRIRREIIRLWRKYNDLEQALVEFQARIGRIIELEADRTAQAVSRRVDSQLTENGSSSVRIAVLAGIAAFILNRARQSAAEIAQTERENVLDFARRLAEEGLSPAEIAAAIRERAPGYSIARSRLIAETEVRAVADEVTRASLEESELEFTGKVWITAGDNRVRESHRDANNQRRDFDQPFTVGGYSLGEPRDGSLGAPLEEIIRCRCVANYLTE